MPMHYTDPSRADDAHALPDLETFYYNATTSSYFREWETGEAFESGWYYQSCLPGCLPDSEPCGPFESEDAALEDARELAGINDELGDCSHNPCQCGDGADDELAELLPHPIALGSDGKLERESDGHCWPAYAWPGGYQIIYFLEDGAVICPACANQANGSIAHESQTDEQWRIIGADVFYEGAPETCEHCNAQIESAYGDPDAEPSEPADDDVTASDPAGPFYYMRKLVAQDRAELCAWMDAAGFFPNAWWISDHGNAHLITDLRQVG